MICRYCHKENFDEEKYCFYCGELLEAEPLPQQQVADLQNENETVSSEKEFPQNRVIKPKYVILIVALISVVISLSAIAFIIVTLINNQSSQVNLSPQNTSAVFNSNENTANKSVENDTTIAKKTYANISVTACSLKENELDQIQNMLEKKSSDTNVNVRVLFDNVSHAKIQKLAEDLCSNECGSDGILFVVNDTEKTFGISSVGEGNDYLPENLKLKIFDDFKTVKESNSVVDLIFMAIDELPNKKSEAEIYRFKRLDNSNQVVYADSDRDKLTLIEWSGYTPKILFETNEVYFGMDGITESPSEYKSATPKGEFKLGFAFSTNSLNTKLNTMTITPGTVWVNDPDSDYYNTVQHGSTSNPPKWSSAEDTYSIFTSGVNYACILIEHNGDGYTKGVSPNGSCMYVSGKNKNLTKSYGDVNISAEDMRELLSYLDKKMNPYIIIN